ncbi:MAG: hypothetical protein J4432_01160 [DPANN group archaeon]|nr:hypothetical protein [DPANN group archaeon]
MRKQKGATITKYLQNKPLLITAALAIIVVAAFATGFADETIDSVYNQIFAQEEPITPGFAAGSISYVFRGLGDAKRSTVSDGNMNTKYLLSVKRRSSLSIAFSNPATNPVRTVSKVRIKGSGWFVIISKYEKSDPAKRPKGAGISTTSYESTPVKANQKRGVDIVPPIRDATGSSGLSPYQYYGFEIKCTNKYFPCFIYELEIYP